MIDQVRLKCRKAKQTHQVFGKKFNCAHRDLISIFVIGMILMLLWPLSQNEKKNKTEREKEQKKTTTTKNLSGPF